MNTTRHSSFVLPSASIWLLLLLLTLFAASTRAPAQTGWGNALSFNGLSQYVVMPSNTWFGDQFTIEAWVYVRSHQSYSRVLDFGNGEALDNVNLCMGAWNPGTPTLQVFQGRSGTDVTSPQTIPTNQWVHLAATFKTNTGVLYVNGYPVATNAAMAPPNPVNRTNNYVAHSNWPGDPSANAIIDDVRIWSVARSQADIATRMLYPLAGNEPDLLAYWQLDEGAGNDVLDATDNGFNGLLVNGPARTNSTVPCYPIGWGSAMSLNGTGNYLALPSATWFSNDLTIEAWVYERDYRNHSRVADFGNGERLDNVVLALSSGTTGKPYFEVDVSGVSHPLIAPTAIPTNQWVHLAATLRGSNATLYVNGVAVASTNNMPPPNGVLTTNNYVGRSNWAANSYANASFDELRIWSVARTAEQICSAMNHPLTGTEPGLAGYWNFDTVWFDRSTYNVYTNPVEAVIFGCTQTNSLNPCFTNVPISGLPGVFNSAVAWADCNNDGRLDFLLMGRNFLEPGGAIGQVWTNGGANVFSQFPTASLPPAIYCSAAWGDYNNDSLLDIAVVGADGLGWWLADTFRNTGDDFLPINATNMGPTAAWADFNNNGRLELWPGIDFSSYGGVNFYACGDYDNDGWPDLLLIWGAEYVHHTEVWRNGRDGTFTNINAGLPGLRDGLAAWGDYDNDGRLDLLLLGTHNTYDATNETWTGDQIVQVWRNTGSSFTNINTRLPEILLGSYPPSIAWGDYDNDGRLDILIEDVWNIRVIRNNGNGTFSEVKTGVPSAWHGAVAWGDYDNDGRLDILATGQKNPWVYEKLLAGVWRNLGFVTNTPPTAPTGLTATPVDGDIVLSWAPASDGQTPANGLSYDLRIGTDPGGYDFLAPPADPDSGFRRIPARGNFQPGVAPRIIHLPPGEYFWSVQAVDTAFAGSPWAAEGSFTVFPPHVETVGITNISPTGGTLLGSVNPQWRDTTAWFEYGLTMRYGSTTVATNIGSGTEFVDVSLPLTDVLPWMTYYFRAVASNGVGVTVGTNFSVTLPGPAVVLPQILTSLDDITLQPGGSTSVWFTVSPGSLDLRVNCDNPVLLPEGSLTLGGSGGSRSLGIVPVSNQSGSSQITVTATDGSRSASRSFKLTVLPSSGSPSELLYLADAQVVSNKTWRFRIVDLGTGCTNHSVEYRPDLSPTNAWVQATNCTDRGGGVIEVNTGPPSPTRGFYRVGGWRALVAGFGYSGHSAAEGTGTAAGAVIVFNGVFNGVLYYSWTDDADHSWTNYVTVNGTTAVLSAPLADDSTIGTMRHLTFRIEPGSGYGQSGTLESTVAVEENDAEWVGALQTGNGMLGLEITLLQTNGCYQGRIKSSSSGFFPTNALTQVMLAENRFTAVATNIFLPPISGSAMFGEGAFLDLYLDATNGPGQTNVSPSQIRGICSLVGKMPGQPCFDSAAIGTFVLLRPPTAPATNEVPLYPVP